MILSRSLAIAFLLVLMPFVAKADPPNHESVKVTVVVPVYNDVETVERAVQSILNQTHHNVEVFVVDDHSNESTYQTLVDTFGRRHDPRLHLIRLNRNVGLYSLKNYVLKNLATGDFFTVQDSDDYSHPERIQREVEHALRYQLDGVGMKVKRISQEGGERVIYTNYPEQKPPTERHPMREDYYVSSQIPSDKGMYRTELAVRIGGFNGHRRVEGDLDFANRFNRVFWTGSFNKFPLYYWVRRSGSLTTSSSTGFSAKKSWLGGRRIPSRARLEARTARNVSKAAANVFSWLGLTGPFVGQVVSDLYYPQDLGVEKYDGPGLPAGSFRHFDPQAAENQQWWRDHMTAQRSGERHPSPLFQSAELCASQYGELAVHGNAVQREIP